MIGIGRVDDAIGLAGFTRQQCVVVQSPDNGLDAVSRKQFGFCRRSNESAHAVTGLDQTNSDGTTDVACCACQEDIHATSTGRSVGTHTTAALNIARMYFLCSDSEWEGPCTISS